MKGSIQVRRGRHSGDSPGTPAEAGETFTPTSVVMAAGTLGVLAVGRQNASEDHALAMAFTTFVLFQS